MRLASYNIRKARGLDRKRSPERILEIISKMGADVVVLQEADLRLGDRPTALPREMIEGETDYHVAPLAQNDVSLGWHGNAVLVKKGVEIVDVGHIDLPGLEPRGAVSVLLPDNTRVVGVHLGLLRPNRKRQLETIRSLLEDEHAARTVIAGDFNEWSTVHAHRPLAPHFQLVPPGNSFPANYPVAALDRIAHGPDLDLTGFGIEDGPESRAASDHLPIWAEFAPRQG
ncbi:endonuclease/exonuclease/phosphatase family protein [Chachezhania antarctica]|uniref:endonuclease/exonuclease/phosphatase family protein n=1 Tax=Chachezhania antarctica TaxID=2340860 RepID=UPI000EB217EA|nr:endonuclease/exonuclease/phosphatase family protein [Chachezhania antarctica]